MSDLDDDALLDAELDDLEAELNAELSSEVADASAEHTADGGALSMGTSHEAAGGDEEEEEEQESGIAGVSATNVLPMLPATDASLVAAATAGGANEPPSAAASSGAAAAAAAAAAGKAKAAPRKRKSTAGNAAARKESPATAADEEARAAKMARTAPLQLLDAEAAARAQEWQADLSAADRDRLRVWQETDLSNLHMRRVLTELQAPLPATRLPPIMVITIGHLAKLMIGEVIQEARRIQQQGQQLAVDGGQQHSAASLAAPQPLDPLSVQQAYHSLVAQGRIPSRVSPARPPSAAPSTQAAAGAMALADSGGALQDASARRPRRTPAWKR